MRTTRKLLILFSAVLLIFLIFSTLIFQYNLNTQFEKFFSAREGAELQSVRLLSGAILLNSSVLMLVVFLVLTLGSAFYLRYLFKPFYVMVREFDGNNHDPDFTIDAKRRDEINILAGKFNKHFQDISRLISDLKSINGRGMGIGIKLEDGSENILANVKEITETAANVISKVHNDEVALRGTLEIVGATDGHVGKIVSSIEKQSAFITQSSASVEELISSIQSFNSITQGKSRLSGQLASLATEGERDLKETVDAIKSMEKSTQSITEMIEVIKNIADQTSLLAMNAAIEAAHAGDAGKGFSVVADEIRKLAETTADNVKIIDDTIHDVGSKIDNAGSMTLKSADSIGNILNGIQDINEAMSELTHGVDEMSSGTDEISKSLVVLVSSTQDIRDASDELQNQSSELYRNVTEVAKGPEGARAAMENINLKLNGIRDILDSFTHLGGENKQNIDEIEERIELFSSSEEK